MSLIFVPLFLSSEIMEEDNTLLVEAIKADPKLTLLAQAITELSEKQTIHDLALKTIHVILADQQNSLKEMNNSLQKVGDAVNVIIKQMMVISQHPTSLSTFRGVIIK